jgi:hypothetical protein
VRLAFESNVNPSALGVGVGAGDVLAAEDAVAVGATVGVVTSLPGVVCAASAGEFEGTGDETIAVNVLACALSVTVVCAKITSSEPSIVR